MAVQMLLLIGVLIVEVIMLNLAERRYRRQLSLLQQNPILVIDIVLIRCLKRILTFRFLRPIDYHRLVILDYIIRIVVLQYDLGMHNYARVLRLHLVYQMLRNIVA